MASRYLTVVVERDPMEKIPVQIPAHEGPVLELVHGGGGSLQIVGEPIDVDTDFEPEAEYERLEAKYGKHPETKQSYVREAYGALSEGRFHKALKAAHKDAKAPKAPAPEVEADADQE
ncbi:MAG TPA: hypothetical protein VNE18_10415 [Rhodanobacter sp.]|nr:hypothetical protein [Rhodanobacter sp.]